MSKRKIVESNDVADVREDRNVIEDDPIAHEEEPMVVDTPVEEKSGLGLGWLPLLLVPLFILGLLFLPYVTNTNRASDSNQTVQQNGTSTGTDTLNGKPAVGVGGSNQDTNIVSPTPTVELSPTENTNVQPSTSY